MLFVVLFFGFCFFFFPFVAVYFIIVFHIQRDSTSYIIPLLLRASMTTRDDFEHTLSQLDRCLAIYTTTPEHDVIPDGVQRIPTRKGPLHQQTRRSISCRPHTATCGR